jgi:hypothetical protein
MNRIRVAVAAAAVAILLLLTSTAASAARPPSGGNPGTPGVLVSHSIVPAVLTAGGADRTAGLTNMPWGPDAYFWIDNFNKATDELTWTVTSDRTAAYNITGLLSTTEETPFTLTDSVNGQRIAVSSHSYGWDRLAMGQLTIPRGSSKLTLKRLTTTSSETDIKSLELIPAKTQARYDDSVADAKANSQWLTDGGYGLFFQYGAWGYPPTGPAKSLDDQACSFDVPKFVSMVQSTGAAYVIWSYTWYTYQVDGPNPAIDRILGSTRDTAKCDLDLTVAKALQQVGIKFMLYYHNGHTQDPEWWAKQAFPAGYDVTGVGDKSTFLKNWTDVVSWAGEHFGTTLAGWWFDDGQFYYPADFAALQEAARAGNPQRLVTWNSWKAAAYTQYEDFQPGETCHGAPTPGSVVGSNGVNLTGPFAGIRAQCLYMLNQDWGVHDPNTTIYPTQKIYGVVHDLDTAMANHTAINFNLMMYENGDVDPATLALLKQVKSIYRDGGPRPTPPLMVNDTSSQITYTGTWGYSANRGAGDWDNDLHYTTTAGASTSITFTGTGIQFLAPIYPGGGSGSVTLDGVAKGTISESGGNTYTAQQVVYSVSGLTAGQHTLVLTDAGGAGYFQVDAFQITS